MDACVCRQSPRMRTKYNKRLCYRNWINWDCASFNLRRAKKKTCMYGSTDIQQLQTIYRPINVRDKRTNQQTKMERKWEKKWINICQKNNKYDSSIVCETTICEWMRHRRQSPSVKQIISTMQGMVCAAMLTSKQTAPRNSIRFGWNDI